MPTIYDYYSGTTDGQDWAYALYRYGQSFTGTGAIKIQSTNGVEAIASLVISLDGSSI